MLLKVWRVSLRRSLRMALRMSLMSACGDAGLLELASAAIALP